MAEVPADIDKLRLELATARLERGQWHHNFEQVRDELTRWQAWAIMILGPVVRSDNSMRNVIHERLRRAEGGDLWGKK